MAAVGTDISWIQIAVLILTTVSGVGVPFIVLLHNKNANERKERFDRIDQMLQHQDKCMDDLKIRVSSEMCSRSELAGLKLELTETLNRMRAAISGQFSDMEKRVQRLESPYFGRQGDD